MKAIDLLEPGALFRGALFTDLAQSGDVQLAPGTRLGVFRIERELARGGMGVVYLAERADGQYHQRVALKVMGSGVGLALIGEAVFRRERQILADLRHPNIARLVDGGQDPQGRPWLAVELVEGARLDRHCIERKLSEAQRLQLFLAVCDAVSFAHGRGVLHRDLKPANVMVDADGSAKLLDFGIAELLSETGNSPAAYTPGYASPEQMRGEALTVASDIFQLGRLLTVLLALHETERKTLRDLAPGPAATELRTVPPPLPGRICADLRAVIARATANDPAQRHASVAALADDVCAYLQRRPVSARPRRAGYLLTRFVQRHPYSVSSAVCGLLLVLAGIAIFTWRLGLERDLSRFEAQRAQAVSAFLLDLFRDGDPTRLIDPALSARALVQTGVRRLKEDVSLPEDVRNELAVTLADIQVRLGEHQQALALIDRLDPQRIQPHRLLELRGRLALGAGQSADAVKHLSAALALMPDPQLELLLARAEADAGDSQSAAQRIESLLARRAELPIGVQLGLLGNLGVMRYRGGEPMVALAFYRDALAIVERAETPSSPAHLHINSALALIDLARFDEALAELDAAEAALHRFPNQGHSLRILQQRGIVHFRQGDSVSALEQWQRMLEGSANGVNPGLHAAALHNLAAGHDAAGDALAVLDYSLQAVQARLALGDRPGALSSQINVAVKYADLGRADLSLALAEQCLQDAKALKRPDLEQRAWLALATAQRWLGDPAVFRSLDAALALAPADGNLVKRLDTHLARIASAAHLGDVAQYQRGIDEHMRDTALATAVALREVGEVIAASRDPVSADLKVLQSTPIIVRFGLLTWLLRSGQIERASDLLPPVERADSWYWRAVAALAAARRDRPRHAQAQAQLAQMSAAASAAAQAHGPAR